MGALLNGYYFTGRFNFNAEISREDLILMLSFKGWTSDELSLMDTETLDNLYIEYIVLENDYV